MIDNDVKWPYEKLSDRDVAEVYRIAVEAFRKPFDEGEYVRLQRNGKRLIESGLEVRMENHKFMVDVSHDVAQFWVETKSNQKNYYDKHADFKRMAEEYLTSGE